MRIRVDKEADALYVGLGEAPATDSVEVAPGIIIDHDADGKMVGIEVLHLSKRSPDLNIANLIYETAP